MVNASRVWHNRLFAATVGAIYDWAIDHPPVARRFVRLMMGADAAVVYRAWDAVTEMPDGSAILDVPCGGGFALTRLHPEQRVRYVAADISPSMLARIPRRLSRHLQASVEVVETDIERMPFADGDFDLCVCVNGLHCVPNPAAAVREIARCLRPGGALIGDFAVRGQIRRADAYMSLLRATATFGPVGTLEDARGWFEDAGLVVDTLDSTGAIAYFCARQPSLSRT